MTTHLPIQQKPAEGESWSSYLIRTASALKTTPSVLADHIGLRQNGIWPPFHGVVLTASTNWTAVTAALGLTRQQILDMHLARYDQTALDLTGLDQTPTPGFARTVSRRGWVFYAGSRYCPTCLADDGIWRSQWRLPLTFACLRHGVLLADRCARCNQRPFGGRLATKPPRAGAYADARLCPEPSTEVWRTTVCGNNLSRLEPQAATAEQLDLAANLAVTIESGAGHVAGRQWPALEVLHAWQAAACWARAFGVVGRAATTWDVRRPWMSPPRDVAVVVDLLEAAQQVIGADSLAEAAGVLRSWTSTQRPGVTPATFVDIAPSQSSLEPVVDQFLEQVGRAHSSIRRRMQSSAKGKSPDPVWGTKDVPQMAWSCVVPKDLLMLGKPGPEMMRLVASLILARAAGARTWDDAGRQLGWQAGEGKQWSRYVMDKLDQETRNRFIAHALDVSERIHQQPSPSSWHQRPHTAGSTIKKIRDAQRGQCRAETPGSDWCPCGEARRH